MPTYSFIFDILFIFCFEPDNVPANKPSPPNSAPQTAASVANHTPYS